MKNLNVNAHTTRTKQEQRRSISTTPPPPKSAPRRFEHISSWRAAQCCRAANRFLAGMHPLSSTALNVWTTTRNKQTRDIWQTKLIYYKQHLLAWVVCERTRKTKRVHSFSWDAFEYCFLFAPRNAVIRSWSYVLTLNVHY